MGTGDDRLPVARLRPRDGNDQLVILQGKAREGARAAGRFAAITSKVVAVLVVCGAGVFLVGSMATHSRKASTYDLDRRLQRLTDDTRRINESIRQMQYFLPQQPPEMPVIEPPRTPNASPAYRTPAKPEPRYSEKLKSQ